MHVHVIPRYRGDVEDPRGGVRYVIPERGNYCRTRAEPLTDGQGGNVLHRAIQPLLVVAREIDILAAFVQDRGLQHIEPHLQTALDGGARVRILTGDYLEITQVQALERLLDMVGALTLCDEEGASPGRLEARVIETAGKPAFHPKSWRIEGADFGAAWVGSSNLSGSALLQGVEWNLRIDRHRDPLAWDRVRESFARLWDQGVVLSRDWVEAYARRCAAHAAAVRALPPPPPPGEVEVEPALPPPDPTPVQEEALAALAACRTEGVRRALVVLATGLGKTFLVAFDLQAFAAELGRAPRVLFVAHRRELLLQAWKTLRRVWPRARFGWFQSQGDLPEGAGDRIEPEGVVDVLLASVQKLSRQEHLRRFAAQQFDYVVIDEVHHAFADSYRRLLDHFEPAFLLGLTATPERSDEGDVFGLFDDQVPFRVDLGEGIDRDLLVPFRYFGLADPTDYEPIPWRNRKFDPAVLATALQTEVRMAKLWEAWQAPDKVGTRNLVFCASIDHADFVTRWLKDRGVRAVAVHTGPGSEDRDQALADLESGAIGAICSVDLFNEGVDCKPVDRVVMLRPTESPLLFLQQLGRGLRQAPGKQHLTVLDFVGNHRVFLDRVRTLLSLAPRSTSLAAYLEGKAPELPPGCEVVVELEAIDLLRHLLPHGSKNELVRVYRETRAARGRRPTAGELVRAGFNPASLRTAHGGWFGFVRSEQDLSTSEELALQGAGAWLREVETTPLVKCFKMVVLEVLLDADALQTGMALAELSRRCQAYLLRSPELFLDLVGVRELPDPRNTDLVAWRRYWEGPDHPIAAWTGKNRKTPGRIWFAVDGEQFLPRIPVPEGAEAALVEMTRELVDARLAQYRRRRSVAPEETFEAKVLHNRTDPILKLPEGEARAKLPEGFADVRLHDGEIWRFKFVSRYCNVATRAGSGKNELPDLLRGWFGPSAGQPGTDFHVRFSPSPDGLWVEPIGARVIPFPERGRFAAFPSLQAAAESRAEVWQSQVVFPEDAVEVRLPLRSQPAEGLFAVRATGDSMDGGAAPIRDGDWVLLRYARGQGLGAVEGRVALVAVGDPDLGASHLLKRIVRTPAGHVLHSDNPAHPDLPAAGAIPIALLVAVVRPEELAPAEGCPVPDSRLAEEFGLTEAPTSPWSRVDGGLFFLIDAPGQLLAPDRLRVPGLDRRPGETAFVLTRLPDSGIWRYAGIGRWAEVESAWAFPALDHATWRGLGSGRSTSRTLPAVWHAQAEALVQQTLARVGEGGWLEARGKRCRLVGVASQGGLRLDGGPEGFAERTVSLTDLGWVLAAADDVARSGGVLDEARVNRLRYLEGTPKGSTRWIDCGWALVVVGSGEEIVGGE